MSGSVYIAQGGRDRNCPPTSTCAYCGREGLWQRCENCHVAYYCTTACQENHLGEHEVFCAVVKAKRLFVEQNIYSIRKLVQEKYVIRISDAGEIVLSVGRYEHPSPFLDSLDSMIAPVLKVDVKATDPRKKERVNASFSMSSAVSVISERLATRIGLLFDRKDVINVVSPRCWKREAYLPTSCLTVECIQDVVKSRNASASTYLQRPALHVAPIVCPNMTIDLLLGRDWLQHFGEGTYVIYGPGDDSSKIKCGTGMHVALPWERLDCSSRSSRHTSYSDHLLAPIHKDVFRKLDDIRGYPCAYSDLDFKFKTCTLGVVDTESSARCTLDPVMCQHDIPSPSPSRSDAGVLDSSNSHVNFRGSKDTWPHRNRVEQHIDDEDRYDAGDDFSELSENNNEENQPSTINYPWEEYTTPEGDVFYYNSETGESSWEMY